MSSFDLTTGLSLSSVEKFVLKYFDNISGAALGITDQLFLIG